MGRSSNLKRIKRCSSALNNIKIIRDDEWSKPLFNEKDLSYRNKTLLNNKNLGEFITVNPELTKDIELTRNRNPDSVKNAPRLTVNKIKYNSVCFNFKGIEDMVILNKDGAFINGENHKTLNEAVGFIEENYPNIEQSLEIPHQQTLNIEPFIL